MLTKAEQIMIFLDRIDCKAIKEQKIQNGKNLLVQKNDDQCIITIFDNGNVRIQGTDNPLKKLFLVWNNKAVSTADIRGQALMEDLASRWREWNEEARWLNDYISKNGMPDPAHEPVEYVASREILFHDYMFRNKQLHTVNRVILDKLIRSWFDRYCFMNMDIDQMCLSFWDNINSSIGCDSAPSIDDIAWSLSWLLVTFCPNKFIKNSQGHAVCPFSGDDQNICLGSFVDAIYPYCSSKKIISYTKSNFNKLVLNSSYTPNVSWIDIDANTPIEELMWKGLQDAGIITVPQFQAFDVNHRYKIDFVIKTNTGIQLGIECDGLEFHARKENYIRDRIRDRYLQERGYYIMRFSSIEIFNSLNSCIEEIDRTFWRYQKGEIVRPGFNKLSYFGVLD